ncbi:MAG: permease-like cell division protein FtsX, partial [Oscillospiraceae bacterium]
MKASSFKYLLKEGCKNVWHNRVMSFTSIGVLTTCLIIIGVAFLMTANINEMVGHIESQNEMVVFLDDVNAEKIKTIEQDIKANENIGEIKFVSKEEALEKTKEDFSKE